MVCCSYMSQHHEAYRSTEEFVPMSGWQEGNDAPIAAPPLLGPAPKCTHVAAPRPTAA